MKREELAATAKAMVAPGKGLLAMDESNRTCNQRFADVGIEPTAENRRAYRELILTTPGLGTAISGAILYDETIHQAKKDGGIVYRGNEERRHHSWDQGCTGAKDLAGFPGEKITEGLDGLRDRLAAYYQLGARFAKWRAVIKIGKGIPSHACIEANAHALARYAALCQEGGVVPIVEPEVLMDGDHSIERCYETTEQVLHTVFGQLYSQRVAFELMILKPNMVMPGKECPNQANVAQVAKATVTCLLQAVPAAVRGVAFLSGGQSCASASAHLNAMNVMYGSRLPWPLTFSYARAIQQPALQLWQGLEANAKVAQDALLYRAKCNRAARESKYSEEMETAEPVLVRIGNE
jgi:fructose-bisphosphate aldolase, class I